MSAALGLCTRSPRNFQAFLKKYVTVYTQTIFVNLFMFRNKQINKGLIWTARASWVRGDPYFLSRHDDGCRYSYLLYARETVFFASVSLQGKHDVDFCAASCLSVTAEL